MSQRFILNALIILFTVLCVLYMIKKTRHQSSQSIAKTQRIQLMTSGIIAFFMDTIGVGSFACNIALAKYFSTFRDEELPGVVNGAQVIPGAIAALFFLGLVDVDSLTLISLMICTCLGGMFGALVIAKLNAQTLRGIMLLGFPFIIFLILSHEFDWLPIGGQKTALHGHELILGCIGIFIAGALTSVGVGLFALVQALLFCLGMSPLIAFPIMTAAGALQQPLSTGIFIYQNKVPLQKTWIISLCGVIGVLLAIPIVTHLSATKLHFLLIGVLSYNTVMMGISLRNHYRFNNRLVQEKTETAPF